MTSSRGAARHHRGVVAQNEAFILTGITNAASEGINRLIKLEARNAFGFRNPVNQRLRSRCASIRAALRPAKPG